MKVKTRLKAGRLGGSIHDPQCPGGGCPPPSIDQP
jgi:hypothetical protein